MRTVIELVDRSVDHLKSALARIGIGQSGEALSVDLRIAGGCPGQRLDFRVELSSQGETEVSHADELRDLHEHFTGKFPTAELATLVQLIDIEAILQLPSNADERYVPDSIVGTLSFSLENSRFRFVFPIQDEEPTGEATSTMTIETDQGSYFLSSSNVPEAVRPPFHRIAMIVNSIIKSRGSLDSREPFQTSCPYVGERSFRVTECTFGWTARYHQNCTTVTVRIQLNPDANVTPAVLTALQTTWANGIVNKWSGHFSCSNPYGSSTITFAVQWVRGNAHHVVRVRLGTATTRSNMTLWDTTDTGDVAAHEFGHMIGNPDEYTDSSCPSRSPVSTGTVMDNNTGAALQRHVERICRSANVLPDEHFSIGLDLI